MPTFIGTPREFKIIIDSLSMPVGVTKADRGAAESLRERLKSLMSVQTAPKSVPQTYSPLRSSWPTGFVRPDKKSNWAHHKPREKSEKVELNNSTTHQKIKDILEGLI